MNVKQLTVAVALLASGAAAMAVEATQWNPSTGQLSRSEVKAELSRAIANGEVVAIGEAYDGAIERNLPHSTLARAEVRQELARARANGELDDRNETYGGFTEPHPHVAARAFAWGKSRHAAKGDGE